MILAPKEFQRRVLPAYFNHANIHTFNKQMNMYGFKKLSAKHPERLGETHPSHIVYVHDQMEALRTERDVVLNWKRCEFLKITPRWIANNSHVTSSEQSLQPSQPSSSPANATSAPLYAFQGRYEVALEYLNCERKARQQAPVAVNGSLNTPVLGDHGGKSDGSDTSASVPMLVEEFPLHSTQEFQDIMHREWLKESNAMEENMYVQQPEATSPQTSDPKSTQHIIQDAERDVRVYYSDILGDGVPAQGEPHDVTTGAVLPFSPGAIVAGDARLSGTYLLEAVLCPYLTLADIARCEVAFGWSLLHKASSVSTHGTRLTDASMEILTRRCLSLVALDLSGQVCITDESLFRIQACLRHLKMLYLKGCDRVSDVGLAVLSQGLPELTSIAVTDCHRITDLGVEALSFHCRKLQSVDLSGCFNISDASIECLALTHDDLRHLSLDYCCKLTDETVSWLAMACPTLCELSMAFCGHLTDKSLKALGVGCHQLAYLNVAQCWSISKKAVCQLLQSSPYLNVVIAWAGDYCEIGTTAHSDDTRSAPPS